MIDELNPIAGATQIRLTSAGKRKVAIVGAGAIVDFAHLPAYRSVGLDVAGIYDLDISRAEDVAARHGIGRVYSSLDELLTDEEVEVVDIAVVPWAQPDILRAAADAGKHVLAQKPLALDVDTARELADYGAAAGVLIGVNQQMRFEEGIAAARTMVHAGWIGEPTTMSFTVDISTDWSSWPWLLESDRLEVMYHSIHYLDSIRSILGDPVRVFGTGARTPGQSPKAETRTMSTLIFPGDVRALVHVTHENRTRDPQAVFRIDGSEGAIKGTLGLLYDYPRGRPDTVEVFSNAKTDGWLSYPVTKRWLPDAFAGPMVSLLSAIEEGTEPATAARDNLRTVQLVHALYASMDSGESVLVSYD